MTIPTHAQFFSLRRNQERLGSNFFTTSYIAKRAPRIEPIGPIGFQTCMDTLYPKKQIFLVSVALGENDDNMVFRLTVPLLLATPSSSSPLDPSPPIHHSNRLRLQHPPSMSQLITDDNSSSMATIAFRLARLDNNRPSFENVVKAADGLLAELNSTIPSVPHSWPRFL